MRSPPQDFRGGGRGCDNGHGWCNSNSMNYSAVAQWEKGSDKLDCANEEATGYKTMKTEHSVNLNLLYWEETGRYLLAPSPRLDPGHLRVIHPGLEPQVLSHRLFYHRLLRLPRLLRLKAQRKMEDRRFYPQWFLSNSELLHQHSIYAKEKERKRKKKNYEKRKKKEDIQEKKVEKKEERRKVGEKKEGSKSNKYRMKRKRINNESNDALDQARTVRTVYSTVFRDIYYP